jgi:peptide/nickel transport system ATP-binding protein
VKPLLSVRGLTVTYGLGPVPALADVDLAVGTGERVAVIGESGSGKSTLGLAIAGLLAPDVRQSGTVAWPGLGRPARNGADLGFVFQDAYGTLDPVWTVGAQLREVLLVHRGLKGRAARREADRLFERVGLSDLPGVQDAYPHALSGGQRQRVGIALAVAAGPAILIADEPTSALDTLVQAQIMGLVSELVAEQGMALLFITHDIALASRHADRIVVLDGGRLVEDGATMAVLAHPGAAATRSLVALARRFSPRRPERGGLRRA